MAKIVILAIGRAKGAFADLCADYAKRLVPHPVLREFSGASQKEEGALLLESIPDRSFVVLLDETGKDDPSRDFSAQLEKWRDAGKDNLVFILGGADGLTESLRKRGDAVMSLGRKTWPHMMARVMLLEQLYRAQQIRAGHPYHRD